jgi:hypothetical protein
VSVKCARCGAAVPEAPTRIDHNGDPICRDCFLQTGCPDCREKDKRIAELEVANAALRERLANESLRHGTQGYTAAESVSADKDA